MNVKRLVAAIGQVRSKLALVEVALEDGDEERALELIEEIESLWLETVTELRIP